MLCATHENTQGGTETSQRENIQPSMTGSTKLAESRGELENALRVGPSAMLAAIATLSTKQTERMAKSNHIYPTFMLWSSVDALHLEIEHITTALSMYTKISVLRTSWANVE